jgi:ligand-binding sensor domain-containing protein
MADTTQTQFINNMNGLGLKKKSTFYKSDYEDQLVALKRICDTQKKVVIETMRGKIINGIAFLPDRQGNVWIQTATGIVRIQMQNIATIELPEEKKEFILGIVR